MGQGSFVSLYWLAFFNPVGYVWVFLVDCFGATSENLLALVLLAPKHVYDLVKTSCIRACKLLRGKVGVKP